MRALNSGWTAKDPIEIEGTTLLEAFQNKAGAENVTYVADATQVPEDLSGTTAIVVIGEESGTHEPSWGTETLEFPQEQVDLVKALKDAGANVVEVVLMNRAYVMTEMVDLADSVLLAYRPGVTWRRGGRGQCALRRDAHYRQNALPDSPHHGAGAEPARGSAQGY